MNPIIIKAKGMGYTPANESPERFEVYGQIGSSQVLVILEPEYLRRLLSDLKENGIKLDGIT